MIGSHLIHLGTYISMVKCRILHHMVTTLPFQHMAWHTGNNNIIIFNQQVNSQVNAVIYVKPFL